MNSRSIGPYVYSKHVLIDMLNRFRRGRLYHTKQNMFLAEKAQRVTKGSFRSINKRLNLILDISHQFDFIDLIRLTTETGESDYVFSVDTKGEN